MIVRLDQALPRAALAQAEANLALARATLRQADAELRRQKDLASRGIASVVELERVEADASRAAAEVARARAQVLDATTRLDKTTIVAPFAALVSSFDLEPGAYVSPGQSVAELLDLSELEIEFGVGDREIGALRAGQTASIRVDVFPAESFSGVIHRVGSAPDARTQRYPIPVRVADPSGRLLPGMLATVRLELGEAVSVLRVPRRAVRTEFDLSYLFAIVGDTPGDGDGLGRGRVVRHRVATRRVPFRPELVDVIRGLDDGSRIAVTGVADLRDGMEVRYRDREISL